MVCIDGASSRCGVDKVEYRTCATTADVTIAINASRFTLATFFPKFIRSLPCRCAPCCKACIRPCQLGQGKESNDCADDAGDTAQPRAQPFTRRERENQR